MKTKKVNIKNYAAKLILAAAAVIIVAVLISAVLFVYNKNTKKEVCYVTLIAQSVLPEVGAQFKADSEMEEKTIYKGRFTDAEIYSVETVAADATTVDNYGNMLSVMHPTLEDDTIIIKGRLKISNSAYMVGGQEVAVGAPFMLQTQHAKAECIVKGIDIRKEETEDGQTE